MLHSIWDDNLGTISLYCCYAVTFELSERRGNYYRRGLFEKTTQTRYAFAFVEERTGDGRRNIKCMYIQCTLTFWSDRSVILVVS